MLASENGYVEVVIMLLQHGARVDLQNKVPSKNYSSYMYYVSGVITHDVRTIFCGINTYLLKT